MSRNLHQEITARVLAALKAGTCPWRQPWSSNSTGSSAMPRNALTGRAYSGVNVPLLWLTAQTNGWTQQLWLTFKQALDMGANVRKGEKGTTICFVSTMEKEENGETIRIPFLKAFSVFNVAQCEKLPEKFAEAPPAAIHNDARDDLADSFVAATGVDLRHGEARAYYRPAGDFVMMPRFESFINGDAYYSTLFHELTHWTGGAARLSREFGKRFGDRAYSVEELTAEMGAAFICAEFGFDNDGQQEQSAAYISHWIKALESDERVFVAACASASRAVEFMRGLALADEVEEVSRAA